ncbi:hypothetical protein Tamer19_09790 [Cupriavidus sp. TA19]|uniref:glycosyltransferase family 87 protein n=1 Tax=Cupriavidus sp. TA19 TaxID=701108 RepID=UPI00272941E6|nr:glycosyltransferase family 87 protein [Cupriavidus sp. TA19]GLC91571.1 hypothetical protein Tamer19_09790 [Cupriavidus sp. TA19]
MSVATDSAPARAPETCSSRGWLTAERLRLYAAAILLIECGLVGAWWYGHWILANPSIPLIGWDFAVYWSASGLVQTHGALGAYDWELLRAAEKPLLGQTFGPFAYPPTFLLLVYPVASVSFGVGLLLFSAIGIALYIGAIKATAGSEISDWLIPAIAFPGIWAALLAGQNSLLTAAACAVALLQMRKSAVVAGACIALICIKPQLGVLVPLMLLCEGRWKVFASAALATAVFVALPAVVFGHDVFPAFLHSMVMFREAVAEHGGAVLRGAPTVFAMLRTAGVDVAMAYACHAAVAAIVAVICAWIWLTRARVALSASALVVGTLLVQPYMIYYDLAWLAIPITLLAADMVRHGGSRVERLILVLTWLAPAHALLVVLGLPTPQLAPLLLLALLAVIVRRHRAARCQGSAT